MTHAFLFWFFVLLAVLFGGGWWWRGSTWQYGPQSYGFFVLILVIILGLHAFGWPIRG